MNKNKRILLLSAVAGLSAGIVPLLGSCGSGLRRGAIDITNSDFNVEYYDDYKGFLVTDYKGEADTLELPNEVRDENGEYKPIKGIVDYAFSKREKLKEVRLSENMEYVGPHAFAESQIEKLVLNVNVREFPVTSLAEAPISLASYGNCQYLPGPGTDYYYLVSYLGSGDVRVHSSCHAIAKGIFGDTFYNKITMDKDCKIEILDTGCLKGKNIGSSGNLVSFSNLQYLGPNCLNGTGYVDAVKLGSKIKKLLSSSLAGCKLHSVVGPETIDQIEAGCFEGCSNLTSITVPFATPGFAEMSWPLSNDTCFKSYFGKYSSSAEVPSNLRTIVITGVKKEDGTVLGARHSQQWLKGVSVISIKVPANMDFYYQDFAGKFIESYPIGDECTFIGEEAFKGCANERLTTLKIPRSVKTIERGAFARNSALKTVYIPKTVKTMGRAVFENSGSYDAEGTRTDFTIYCEAESKPEGWDSRWNDWGDSYAYVRWGAKMPY